MLPETYTTLRDHGYARGEQQIDRAKLADACRDLLLDQPVTTDQEIPAHGLIVPELRHRLFGDAAENVEHELDAILAPLTGPTGPVQDRLENGYVLCSAPVERRLTGREGSTLVLKRNARFVTENHDLIEEHYWVPAQARIAQAVKGLNGRFELSIRRQPQLAARKPALIGKVHAELRAELPEVTG